MKFVTKVILFMGILLGPCWMLGVDRLNILFFLVDDLGAHDLSCTGSEIYETPAIDRLADRPVRFTHAYAPHPRCVTA